MEALKSEVFVCLANFLPFKGVLSSAVFMSNACIMVENHCAKEVNNILFIYNINQLSWELTL